MRITENQLRKIIRSLVNESMHEYSPHSPGHKETEMNPDDPDAGFEDELTNDFDPWDDRYDPDDSYDEQMAMYRRARS